MTASQEKFLSDSQKLADSIDRELFRLSTWAESEWERTKEMSWLGLYWRIKDARSKSFQMLPEWRKEEVR